MGFFQLTKSVNRYLITSSVNSSGYPVDARILVNKKWNRSGAFSSSSLHSYSGVVSEILAAPWTAHD